MNVFRRTLIVWAVLVGAFLLVVVLIGSYGAGVVTRIDINHHYTDAQDHLKRGEFQDAVIALKKVLEVDSARTDALRDLVLTLNRLGRYQEARDHSEALVRQSAEDDRMEALLLWAAANYALGHLDEAQAIYHKVATAVPACGEPYLALATIALEQQRFSEMVKHLAALARSTNDGCSDSYIARYEEVHALIDQLEVELVDDVPSAERYYRLGVAYWNVGRWTDAISAFGDSTAFDQFPADALFWLAIQAELDGDRVLAQNHYERVLERNPSHRRSIVRLVQLLQ